VCVVQLNRSCVVGAGGVSGWTIRPVPPPAPVSAASSPSSTVGIIHTRLPTADTTTPSSSSSSTPRGEGEGGGESWGVFDAAGRLLIREGQLITIGRWVGRRDTGGVGTVYRSTSTLTDLIYVCVCVCVCVYVCLCGELDGLSGCVLAAEQEGGKKKAGQEDMQEQGQRLGVEVEQEGVDTAFRHLLFLADRFKSIRVCGMCM
jgi:hypothetical protein